MICVAQQITWRSLVDSIKADPWDLAYGVVTRKIKGKSIEMEVVGREMAIVERLFPSTTPSNWSTLPLW